MATRRLGIPAYDDTGAPKSGLTPSWDAYTIDGASTSAPAAPAEIASTGLYETPAITLTSAQRLFARVDLGATAYPRYWVIREQGAQWAAEDVAAGGSGARTVTVTVTGVVGARVLAYLSGTLVGKAYTNGSGVATLYLDDGTYTLQTTAPGYNADSRSLTVDAAESVTVGLQALDSDSTSPVGKSRSVDVAAPSLGVEISGVVAGDSGTAITLTRTVTSVPAAITKAWFTVKRAAKAFEADATSAIVQLEITSSSGAAGQITDTGADGTGALSFTMTSAQSALLTEPLAYDVQILTSAGVATVETGTIDATAGMTTSTA